MVSNVLWESVAVAFETYSCSMLHTEVKKDGKILDEVKLIGLAVEKAHKAGRRVGWGSVAPSHVEQVSLSGNVQTRQNGSACCNVSFCIFCMTLRDPWIFFSTSTKSQLRLGCLGGRAEC